MSNLVGVLKAEFRKLARKEVRGELKVPRRLQAQHRRLIAELNRQIQNLVKRISYLEKQQHKRPLQSPSDDSSNGGQVRFSPAWLKSHRKKCGLSAAQYAKLIGVSTLSVYHWEHGKSRPRRQQLEALAEVRNLGKREVRHRLKLK